MADRFLIDIGGGRGTESLSMCLLVDCTGTKEACGLRKGKKGGVRGAAIKVEQEVR